MEIKFQLRCTPDCMALRCATAPYIMVDLTLGAAFSSWPSAGAGRNGESCLAFCWISVNSRRPLALQPTSVLEAYITCH